VSKFKVGDRVVIVKALRADNIGRVATVLTEPRPFQHIGYAVTFGTLVHVIDAPSVLGQPTSSCPPAWLEPYRPDHNEKVAWTPELLDLCRQPERV
jgi:hypothetical protein